MNATNTSNAAELVNLVFDANTNQVLGLASPQLADQAGIRQHMGDLWARKVGNTWVHWSRAIAADAPFASEARNVCVEAVDPSDPRSVEARGFLTLPGTGITAHRTPKGPWMLVGAVPALAGYERINGEPLTQSTIDMLVHAGSPQPLGCRVRTYESAQAATDAALAAFAVTVVDCLGRMRAPAKLFPDGSYNCPFCGYSVRGGSEEAKAQRCQNPACFARLTPYPAELAQEHLAAEAARKKSETDRIAQAREASERAAQREREEQARTAEILAEAERRGACKTCALHSARYGLAPKYTKHKKACPRAR